MRSQLSNKSEIEAILSQTLKKFWGYDTFRKHQLEICQSIIHERRDCFFMMGTGSGKSLVFQLPVVALREIGQNCCTLVISPLLSLIEDQVSSLLAMGIKACAIGGNCDRKIEDAAMLGYYSLIYATPEKILLWQRGLQQLQQHCEILSIAIDESHCVSEWGCDFRPEYSLLRSLRDWLGAHIPIVALTASATAPVQQEILANLALKDPLVIRDTVNRPNLKYIVRNKSFTTEIVRCLLDCRLRSASRSNGFDLMNTASFGSHIDNVPFPPTLIYVSTKKQTEDISRELVNCKILNGIKAAFYHSGMSTADRTAVLRAFLCDDIQVVVATTAFGMGINKPDIRLIIHYGLPLSIESYYQQTGRAGRDGLPSKCILFWNNQDLTVCNNLISTQMTSSNAATRKMTSVSHTLSVSPQFTNNPSGTSSSFENPAVSRLTKMYHYVRQIIGCRRKMIIEYFQEFDSALALSPNCCDLCDKKLAEMELRDGSTEAIAASLTVNQDVDISEEVYMLLSVIFDTRSFYGISVPIAILSGKNDKNVQRIPSYQTMDFYGQGTHHSYDWWKALANQLTEYDNFLEKVLVRHANGYSFMKYRITSKGIQYLTGNQLSQYDSGLLLVQKLPFNLLNHQYKTTIHHDLMKIIQVEQQIKEMQLKNKQSTGFSRSNSANPLFIDPRRATTNSAIAVQKNAFSYYHALRQDIENALKTLRKGIATELKLTPYQLLTSTEICQLVDLCFSEEYQVTTSKTGLIELIGTLSMNEDEFMNVLNWPQWKRYYAQSFVQSLRLFCQLKRGQLERPISHKIEAIESKMPEEEAEEEKLEGDDDITLADDEVINAQEKSVSDPSISTFPKVAVRDNNGVHLYRPDYAERVVAENSSPTGDHLFLKNHKSSDVEKLQPSSNSIDLTNDDGDDSDATCEQHLPRSRSDENCSSHEASAVIAPPSEEDLGWLAVYDEEIQKENSLNRISSTDSSAANKAIRKRHMLAGFGNVKVKRKTI